MVNIIKKKLDIENEALKKFEMIGKFISCKPKIITGSIRSIDKTNISYIEPHRIIYNKTTFLFFNFNMTDGDSLWLELKDKVHIVEELIKKGTVHRRHNGQSLSFFLE